MNSPKHFLTYRSEFVLVINGMHATVEYLNEIFKVDEKEFFKVPNDQSGRFKNINQSVIK